MSKCDRGADSTAGTSIRDVPGPGQLLVDDVARVESEVGHASGEETITEVRPIFALAEEEGLAAADPPLPTAVGLPSVAGYEPPASGLRWRRRRDLNPRYHHWYSGFQDRRLKPLGHSSGVSSLADLACRNSGTAVFKTAA